MRPHINPARQESTGQGGHCSGLPLLSWRIKQGISALMLRRTHSRQLHAGASFAEMAAGLSPGLNGKEDAAVQHHSAMPDG